MALAEARFISTGIECAWQRANEYLANPANFAEWAEGLGQTFRHVAGRWIAETPIGLVAIEFTPRNDLGVHDHWVTLPDRSIVYVPLRVVRNGAGCEVTLTLFRQPGMGDEKFAEDATLVERDLLNLKRLLESSVSKRRD
jgi:hypothetical protein